MRRGKAEDLTRGPLGGRIFRFSLFVAATGLLQQLFTAADLAVAGRFAGKAAMAAVGCNVPVAGLVLCLLVGTAVGANVVVANAIGRGDPAAVRKAVKTAVAAPFLCGLAAAVALQPAVAPSLRALGVPQDVMPMASAYLSIFLWCVPFSMTVNFASAIFRARGDARTPLACLTASGVANVLLNLLFVAGFGMDADGVALATVISNVLAAAALLFILSRTGGAARWRPRDWRPDARALLEMMRIGLPSGVQGAMFAASNIVIQNAINSLGTDVMAGSAAAFNLEILPFYAVNAFGQAATSFIGQNLGANRISRCRHAMKSAFSQALVWGAVFAAAILLAAEPLLALFNRDPAVIAAGRTRLLYINIPVWLDVAIELYSGALRGCGISHKPAIISVFGICGVRVVWMLAAFPLDPTFETLLWSYPLSWAATAVLLGVAWHRHIRRLSLKPAARTAPAERSGA